MVGCCLILLVLIRFSFITTNASFFLVSTVYQSAVTFDLDTDGDADSHHILTVQTAAAGIITGQTVPLTITDTTAGQSSDYTFAFSSNVILDVDNYLVIKLPTVYDIYVGKVSSREDLVRYVWAEPTYNIIRCSSEELGSNIECIVDHRMIRIRNAI